MNNKLQKIDAIALPDHSCLDGNDECYFILSYTSHKSYDYSDANSIIYNLKKSVSKKGTPEYKYKERAIETCANYLRQTNIYEAFSKDLSFIPIPPSKRKDDPEYDDRLLLILKKAFNDDIDIKEAVIQNESTDAVHLCENRPTKDEIKANYTIDENLLMATKDTIIIFDDVITTGSHFKAIKEFILEKCPQKRVLGMFVARRVFEENDNSAFLDFAAILNGANSTKTV